MCSSRLALDPHGRLVAVATTGAVDVEPGRVWIVIGNLFEAGEPGIRWLGRSGRPPTAEEIHKTRYACTYRPASERRQVEQDDEHLADEEAIRLARLEQQREPADLLQAVAAELVLGELLLSAPPGRRTGARRRSPRL